MINELENKLLLKNKTVFIIGGCGLIGFETTISLSDGIKETMEWFQKNKKDVKNRYNVFTESETSKGAVNNS